MRLLNLVGCDEPGFIMLAYRPTPDEGDAVPTLDDVYKHYSETLHQDTELRIIDIYKPEKMIYIGYRFTSPERREITNGM